ncbi:MAG: hypothetical protein IPO98_12605 [Saprospiraceae bacterium]|nr:hypothetical protein [Saprospiraceae bacterium]
MDPVPRIPTIPGVSPKQARAAAIVSPATLTFPLNPYELSQPLILVPYIHREILKVNLRRRVDPQ